MKFVGEAGEAVAGGQKTGDSGGDALGRSAFWVVHVAEHNGAAGRGGNDAADLPGAEGSSPVAVDREGDEAVSHRGDDLCRDVVAIGGAGPEEARRDT